MLGLKKRLRNTERLNFAAVTNDIMIGNKRRPQLDIFCCKTVVTEIVRE